MSERILVFLDTETTSLDRERRRVWDVAYIIRRPGEADRERQFFVDVDLEDADPMSLKIGGYYERHPNPFRRDGFSPMYSLLYSEIEAAKVIARDFRDAILVGAVPSFDEETLARLLRSWSLAPTWHYHLVDVESLAAGSLKMEPPWDFDKVLDLAGLAYADEDRHTALGDARMVRDLYDAVMGLER